MDIWNLLDENSGRKAQHPCPKSWVLLPQWKKTRVEGKTNLKTEKKLYRPCVRLAEHSEGEHHSLPEIPKIHGYIPTQGEPAEPLWFPKVARDDPNRHIPNRIWLTWSPCGSDLLFVVLKCFLQKNYSFETRAACSLGVVHFQLMKIQTSKDKYFKGITKEKLRL